MQLVDQFLRKVNYLRVSVTDRCDLRCVYCMKEKMNFLPKKEILTLEEIERLCDNFIELGVEKIRLTGGEPLVRKNILSLIENLNKKKSYTNLKEITLTTNGSLLKKYAKDLKNNGVDRINVSLDTIIKDQYKQITRLGNLDNVLDGIDESIAYNEVSLMRQSHQASKFQIKINDVIRLNELICDGVLVSTSAGSTAYNLSAHGSILPLDSKLLALTPISAFRPRRWRGALLSEKSVIKIDVLNFEERKTSVTADNIEFRNIKKVLIKSSQDKNCKILFDKDHSIEDKILNEQFEY